MRTLGRLYLAAAAIALCLAGCYSSGSYRYQPHSHTYEPPPGGEVLQGKASWYGPGFHGKRTASGERFNQNAMTAAHRSLPFGTIVRVINLQNGRAVDLRINDRGPFIRGRIIDVSRAAADQLNMVQAGVVPVEVHVLRFASN